MATPVPAPAPSPTVSLPSAATLILGLIAGVLTGLVHSSFGFGAPWANYASITLVFISALGVSPLVGTAFRNALHLPPTISLIITAALTAAAVGATQIGLSVTDVAIVQGVVAFVGTLGFGIVPVPPMSMRRFLT